MNVIKAELHDRCDTPVDIEHRYCRCFMRPIADEPVFRDAARAENGIEREGRALMTVAPFPHTPE
jgi:hypothetical protein